MSEGEHGDFPEVSTTELPVADIKAKADEGRLTLTQTFEVKQPADDLKDFMVSVRASTLSRCRSRLEKVKGQRFTWGELLLGLATLSAGAIGSAILAGVTLASAKGVFFFVFLPPITVGALVGYIAYRRAGAINANRVAEELLTDLPDPDRSS